MTNDFYNNSQSLEYKNQTISLNLGENPINDSKQHKGRDILPYKHKQYALTEYNQEYSTIDGKPDKVLISERNSIKAMKTEREVLTEELKETRQSLKDDLIFEKKLSKSSLKKKEKEKDISKEKGKVK